MSLVDILSMMNAMGVEIVSSENTPASQILVGIASDNGGNLSWCSAEGLGMF